MNSNNTGYTSGILHQHYTGQLPIAWYVFDTHNIPESGLPQPLIKYT